MVLIYPGQWFEPFSCHFLFDDIWSIDESDVRDFELLKNLAHHPLSGVSFTRHDSTLKADMKVAFVHREGSGENSREILLTTAGLKTELEQPSTAKAFEELPGVSNGLPLRIAFVSGGVRKITELYLSQTLKVVGRSIMRRAVRTCR